MNRKRQKISLIDVKGSYMGKSVVNGVTISFDLNKKNVIIGSSGSGKSTLLKMIAGLFELDDGSVFLDDVRVKGPEEKLIPGHPEIAYVGQYAELKNNYKVSEYLSYDNECSKEENETLYDYCNISHLLNRWTDELSGGEKQRIALAKLLTVRPAILILDEPFSHLDNYHKKTLGSLIDRVCRKFNIGCIMVSHDAGEILSWADQIYVMENGLVIESGSPEELYHHPETTYTANLIGEMMILKPDRELCEKLKLPPDAEGESLLVRPGYFSVCEKGKGSLTVSVYDVLFLGDHYLLKARYKEHDFLLREYSNNITEGDETDIIMVTENLHRIVPYSIK